MAILLLIFSLIAAVIGVGAFVLATTIMHQVLAALSLLAAAVLLSGSIVTNAIAGACKHLEAIGRMLADQEWENRQRAAKPEPEPKPPAEPTWHYPGT